MLASKDARVDRPRDELGLPGLWGRIGNSGAMVVVVVILFAIWLQLVRMTDSMTSSLERNLAEERALFRQHDETWRKTIERNTAVMETLSEEIRRGFRPKGKEDKE